MLNWVRNFFRSSNNTKPNAIEESKVEYQKAPEERKVEYQKSPEVVQQSKGLDEAIRMEAYYLWEQDGKPEGKADYYWQKASERVHQARRELAH